MILLVEILSIVISGEKSKELTMLNTVNGGGSACFNYFFAIEQDVRHLWSISCSVSIFNLSRGVL